LHLPQ